MTFASIEICAFYWLILPLALTKRIVTLWSLLETVGFLSPALGKNVNNHTVCMFCFAMLCHKNDFIQAYFYTYMAGLHPTCSAFSLVLLRCQLVFISYWVQTDGFIAKVCKQLILYLPSQGLVQLNYIVIWKSMRPLELMNHSNQIWK